MHGNQLPVTIATADANITASRRQLRWYVDVITDMFCLVTTPPVCVRRTTSTV